ncbi:polycystic kidney disease 1 like 1 [Cyprinodon tularosa]|uniref:polycystic kidney disease 1 like 1 n=1 Tax=Cyprinodon tularosa TaxID=77115 RepID=UPI0018E23883|nr:polycystic kidney disease 1 like 1 [Cyprinodon tularosa]
MLIAHLHALIVALLCVHSASSSPPGHAVSVRFARCVNSSLQDYTPTGVRDLDPKSCVCEGCQFVLSSETCSCGNQLHALVVSACFNSSVTEETKDVKEGSKNQSSVSTIQLICSRSLMIYFLQGPRGTPPCCPSPHLGSSKEHVEDVTVTLDLEMKEGVNVVSFPGIRHKQREKMMEDVEEDCPSSSELLKFTLVAECPFIFNLSLNVSDYQLRAGDIVSEGNELFKLTVEAESNHSSENLKDCVCRMKDCDNELLFDIPGGTTNQTCRVSFSISAESDVTACLLVNATPKHRSSSCTAGAEATVVLLFNRSGTVVIQLRAENQVSFQSKCVRMCVRGKRKLQAKNISAWKPPAQKFFCIHQRTMIYFPPSVVRIYAEQQVYPTNKDITFLAVSDIPDPVEFFWDFGDSKWARTSLRSIIKRYHNPGSYKVMVAASWGQMTVTSDPFSIEIQRVVKLSRLVHQTSVLQNQTLIITCRVSVGTNMTFMWSFGDGITRTGLSTTHHIYHRLGEFLVKVTASNLISSASLSSHVFVVDRPCQPPPVKNMGPLKLQFQRHEVIHLGVTFDTNMDTSEGLHYTWTLFGSGGQIIPLPHIDTQGQSLTLQSHLLQYDTYTAIARVGVIGSVVYSNYTVTLQVKPSPLVAFIQGGTNVFIRTKDNNMITMDGQKSYDPDYPDVPLSYSWTCKPMSIITSSCFNQDIPTSSSVLKFPTSSLKPRFDQFHFTLTVHSRGRSASSETFLTVTPHLTGKVSVLCYQCQGDRVNWDQSFSVSALCEDCNIPSKLFQFTWSLYLVNTSSKPLVEVPFCHTVEISPPAAILENPTTSTQTPESTSLQFQPQDLYLGDWGSTSEESGDKPHQFDSSSESSYTSVFDQDTRIFLDRNSLKGISSEFPGESSTDWKHALPLMEDKPVAGQPDKSIAESDDYAVLYPNVEEGDSATSAGRPNGVDAESYGPSDDSKSERKDEGNYLMDPKPSVLIQEPTLLDLHRDAVDRDLFESYTYTGISSSLLRFRPFSLKPRSIYMLQVIAKSQNTLVGRTQLFLKTNPVPGGMTCQVQPVDGMELYTTFSIFCTSGQEDLEYKYSFSVGSRPPRMLYQGRDFQYYFSLPSGDPSNDYEVKIYTQIRCSSTGSATKPCPVTVRVRPSFLRNTSSSSSDDRHDPALKLSESLRTVSTLMQLGNPVEILNYISLLTSILNRLSQDAEATTQAQRHTRNVLICTLCQLKGSDQLMMADSISVLNELLQFQNQVTLSSVRHVASQVRSVSKKFPEFTAKEERLHSLINLLSYCLQVVTGPGSSTKPQKKDCEEGSDCSEPNKSTVSTLEHGEAGPAEPLAQLVEEILLTAADLMLRFLLSNEAKVHKVKAGPMTLLVSTQNQSSTIIQGGFTTIHMPAAPIRRLFAHHTKGVRLREQQPCVLRVMTELSHNYHLKDSCPEVKTGRDFIPTSLFQLTGPVVYLSLFRCSTRRKLHIHSLSQPINIKLQLPQRNESSPSQYILLSRQINYHNFTISQQLLQRSIQVTVVFTPLPSKPFPIMLLFRMFERPTPSMHHLQRIHRWEHSTIRLTLPPSYLNAAGVAHIALLDANFGRLSKSNLQSQEISYSVTVDSSLCLSWDGQQRAWTHHDCRTYQTDMSSAVNCSCYGLRPMTVFQQQIQSSQDSGDLDPFLSASSNVTVLSILVILLVLYILGLVWSKRADIMSKENQRVHFLSDNNPEDPYLYAVCIHTGLYSAAHMTAKVYIALYGEDGFSQTKELQNPGCTLFRRNTKDTFILSATESLGPVWGVHIWHDNSGLSPDWYLKEVVVSEVKRAPAEARSWQFVSECWLAVNKVDGQVERMLRVCSQEIHFAKKVLLRFCDYLADFHMWLSVYSCPSSSSFTHTQRLNVCLLLILGYACANSVIVSQIDVQLPFEVGIVDLSDVSLTTGLLSVMVALPVATLISLLFRLTGCGVQHAYHIKTAQGDFQGNDSELDYQSSWVQRALRNKYQGTDILHSSIHENKDTEGESTIHANRAVRNYDHLVFEGNKGQVLHKLLLTSNGQYFDHTTEERTEIPESRRFDQPVRNKLRLPLFWCRYAAWVLCLLLSLACLVVTAGHGMRFSSSRVLLWIQSLCVSLMGCVFLIQPVLIFALAMIVSFWFTKAADRSVGKLPIETNLWSLNPADGPGEKFTSAFYGKNSPSVETLLRARQRARYLRLMHPPTQAEVRKTRGKRRRDAQIQETLRDLFFCTIMLLLMVCIISGSSQNEHQSLNKAIKRRFIRNNYSFTSIKTHEDWWRWTQSSLLDFLYQNSSARKEPHVVIGEPIIEKREILNVFKLLGHVIISVHGKLQQFEAALNLKSLYSSTWINRQTVAVKVQFTLYSPAPHLFSSVTLTTEQIPGGVLLHSVKVQSVRLFYSPTLWDYVTLFCKLLFLFLSLIQSCNQVSNIAQQGLTGCWRSPCMWLDVGLLAVTLICNVCYICRSTMTMEVVNLLQTQHRGHVDVSAVANWEQNIRTFLGVIIFLLTMKCVAFLRMSRTFSSSAAVLSQMLSSLLWPMVSGLILLLAFSCTGYLLYAESSFSSVPPSLQTLLCHYRWPRVTKSPLNSKWGLTHWAVLFLTTTAVWAAMILGAFSLLVKRAKRSQSRNVSFSTGDILCYMRRRVSEFTGRQRQARKADKRRIFVLDELESSVDELLSKLNVLSNSMHRTHRAHCYREEDTPVISASPQSSIMDTQGCLRSEMTGGNSKTGNKATNESQERTTSPGSHLFKCKAVTRIQTLSEEANDLLKIKNWLSSSESTSLVGFWTEDMCENQPELQGGTNSSCWFNTTKSKVVEVLVHKEPGTGEL